MSTTTSYDDDFCVDQHAARTVGVQRMFRPSVLGVLLATLLLSASETLPAQSQLSTIQEIKLPVPIFRGIWWSAELQSRWFFSMLMTPDNALLVYQPDKNGKWPLLKVKQWWTKIPETLVLKIPGWSGKDDKNLDKLNTDLQITPDGRYALTFAIAEWRKSTAGLARKPDVIITVVDLTEWQVVGSFHFADLGLGTPDGARILRNNTLALKGFDWKPSGTEIHYKLFSLPALRAGDECSIETPAVSAEELKIDEQARLQRENAACEEVLMGTGTGSTKSLNAYLSAGKNPAPKGLEQSSYLLRNSIFESPAGDWYRVDSTHSELTIWNFAGEAQLKRRSPNLFCEGQQVQGPAWDCSCNIVAVAKDQNVLLAACLTQHDNFLGWQVWLKQWLSVFRADDLSEIGSVALPSKNEETKELVADADGRTYVLAVSVGDTLRIYEVPNR